MPTAPGYADCAIEITHASMPRRAYVTFGVDPTDTDPLLVCASIISAISGATSFQGLIDSTATLTRVRVSLGVDGAEDRIGDQPIALAGLKSGAKAPPNVALLIHKRTTRGGRRGRGRAYIPWSLDGSEIGEDGVILGASLTSLQTKASAWLSAMGSNAVPMVILHDTGLTAPGSPNPVTALQVDTRVGTQRRRLGR